MTTSLRLSRSTSESVVCNISEMPKEIRIARDWLADEIRQLRSKVKELEAKNAELEHIHQLDMAEIAYQRRQIDFLMDAAKEEEDG